MKKSIKKNNAITLVALVITIIILLILAGITISQLTGSGLFEKAQLAEQKSKNAQEKEDGILSDYENKIGKYVEGNRETVTIDKEEYESMKAKLDNLFDYSNHEEKVIGTWYNGKTMYEVSIPITLPTTTANGTEGRTNLDVSKYNIDMCILSGYIDVGGDTNVVITMPFYNSTDNNQVKLQYRKSTKMLEIFNYVKPFSGATGYVTLQYTKAE